MTSVALTRPLARKDDIIIQELPDETLVYDLRTHRAHCLNNTAAIIWGYCDGKSSIDELTRRLAGDLDHPVEKDLVLLCLDRLAAAGLLEVADRNEFRQINRRQLIRSAGIGAALAIPLIVSIIAPEAAQAATCRPNGSSCSSSSQCCSNCCRGTPRRCRASGCGGEEEEEE